MSYEWNTAALPAATFDGQLQIDRFQQIYRWDAAADAWIACPTYSKAQAFSQLLGINGMPIGNDFWGSAPRIATENSVHWDTVYNKCFVELRWGQAGIVQYIAQVTYAELKAWMQANGPQAGGNYASDCILTAYEVVSPDMRITRTMTMNRLYGALRGRKGYYGGYGRTTPENGQYRQAGYGTRFSGYFTGAGTLTRDLILSCWGQTPAAEEPRVIWFPSGSPANKYRIGKGVLYFVGTLSPGPNGRRCWDTATQTFVDAPVGQYDPDPGVTRSPRWLYVDEPAGSILKITRMSQQITYGSAVIWERAGVVVLLPLQSGTFKSLLAYPLGITHLTINIPQALGEVCDTVFLNQYGDSAHGVYPLLLPAGSAQNPVADMFRYPIGDITVLKGPPGTPKRRSLDFEGIPSSVSFYLRHPVTGLRSALADRQIVKVMRKNNAAIAWNEASLVR